MNQDQIQSIVRTLLKVVGSVASTYGATKLASAVSTPAVVEAVAGLAAVLVGIYLSHSTHADSGSGTANTAAGKDTTNAS